MARLLSGVGHPQPTQIDKMMKYIKGIIPMPVEAAKITFQLALELGIDNRLPRDVSTASHGDSHFEHALLVRPNEIEVAADEQWLFMINRPSLGLCGRCRGSNRSEMRGGSDAGRKTLPAPKVNQLISSLSSARVNRNFRKSCEKVYGPKKFGVLTVYFNKSSCAGRNIQRGKG